MKWKPSSPMTRSRDQKLRPIIAGAAFLTFVALVYTIYQGGLSQFRVSGDVSNPLAPGLKNDEVVYAAPSNKYAAGNTVGLETHRDVKVVSAKKFDDLIAAATSHTRKRKMTDLTKDPKKNSMQTLINTWTDGSYSPVHRHNDYSEAFVTLKGALAFFTFTDSGEPTCTVLHDLTGDADRAIVVEKGTWHAMTAAPASLGWPGYAVVFETSGHVYDPSKPVKALAPFAPVHEDGLDGDPVYFQNIISKCPSHNSGPSGL